MVNVGILNIRVSIMILWNVIYIYRIKMYGMG